MTGELTPGQKLPIEPDLSAQYGVSRSTVREALRVLASQNLVTTTRGVSGGSFVAHPNPEQISGYLEASLRLLAQAEAIPLTQVAEARDLLEVPAAGLAAVRRSEEQLEELRRTMFEPDEVSSREAAQLNKEFHFVLMRSTGSPLVEVLMKPVFELLYDHAASYDAPPEFWNQVTVDHGRIFAAIADRDAVRAQEETRDHLRNVRPSYT
jgi:DNA-binding FadR family transcriptional regulator